jgi:hypothetical protein
MAQPFQSPPACGQRPDLVAPALLPPHAETGQACSLQIIPAKAQSPSPFAHIPDPANPTGIALAQTTKHLSPDDQPSPYYPSDRPMLASPPTQTAPMDIAQNITPLQLDQYGSNLSLLTSPLPKHKKKIVETAPTQQHAQASEQTVHQTTDLIPARLKGKAAVQPPTQKSLRRSQHTTKQTLLFPVLVPTPTKAKPKLKATRTLKALKMAIEAAGLTDKLKQDELTKVPLDPAAADTICRFVSMKATVDTQQTEPPAPTEQVQDPTVQTTITPLRLSPPRQHQPTVDLPRQVASASMPVAYVSGLRLSTVG